MSVSGLWAGMPLPPEDVGYDQRIMETEKALRQAADASGAVILGRAGVFVLARRPDTLHVRLDGPEEARCRQAMSITTTDRGQAARELKDGDLRARRAYIEHFYPGEDWDDPRHYHLVLDSTSVPLDTVVEIVVAVARARFAGLRVGGVEAGGSDGGGDLPRPIDETSPRLEQPLGDLDRVGACEPGRLIGRVPVNDRVRDEAEEERADQRLRESRGSSRWASASAGGASSKSSASPTTTAVANTAGRQ